MKNKSTFTYEILNVDGRTVISIIDLNEGMSVTNNIENVIRDVCKAESLTPGAQMVIYRDSDNRWDGFDYTVGEFVHLGCTSEDCAIKKYCELDAVVGL